MKELEILYTLADGNANVILLNSYEVNKLLNSVDYLAV
jgi:hypothetical protein